MITQKEVKEHLEYNSETGVFTWKFNKSNIKAGDVAGSIDAYGYRQISLKGMVCKAHRIAFLYMTGEIPEQVDHINHIREDNRWVNLRSATNKSNQRNKTLQKNNTSGFVGVNYHKQRKKWVAEIKVNRKKKHLGLFKDKEDAIAARKAANIEYGFHANHGMA